jgi:2-polyprenyl-3-methyl-5-hydroxy-6-metoxy-1,4-benzoquinol methylase
MNKVEKSSISPAIATARFFARKPFPSGSIKTERCPLCKGTRIQKDFLGGGTRWSACSDCKSFFAETFPTDEEATEFYKTEYRETESKGTYPEPSHKRAQVMRAARQLALVFGVLKDCGTALDFGCALGWSVHVMQFLGMDAYGVEMGEYDREWAKEHIGLTLYEYIEDVPVQTFDLIIMSHVLEHFIDPIAHLQKMYEHLNPGGRIIIEVPNFESPSAWSAFHAVVFNTESLQHTAIEAGFQVQLIRSKDTDTLYPPTLIWMVARKPDESDADDYTEVRDASVTAHTCVGE